MNQYQRMVSYLYQYHQEEKGENVGYVRVERKQQKCQIVIKMRPVTLEHMPEIRLFIQEPDGIVYVPAGNLSVGGNSLEQKLVTISENVLQSGKSIDSFEGLLLYVSAKTYFATSWKNDRIFLGDMRTISENESAINQTSENTTKASDDFQTDNNSSDSTENTTQPKNSETNNVNNNHTAYNSANETPKNNLVQNNNIPKNTYQNQKNNKNTTYSPDINETYKNGNDNQNTPKEGSGEIHAAMVEGELTAAEESIVKMSLNENSRQNSPETTENIQYNDTKKSLEESEVEMQSVCSICPFKRKTLDYGKRMLCTFPHMHPFPDGRIRECVRIEPQDIGCLPIRLWSLANNNFLLQGYFNYRHLLFLELSDGNYAIGVPGIFTQKEKGTAYRFAFPKFMPLSSEENCNGAFGYWLQTLPRTLA